MSTTRTGTLTGASGVARNTSILVAVGTAALLSGHVQAASWYVDGLHGKQSNAGSAAAPFQFFWQGVQAAKPGDTVYVLPTVTYPHMSISNSGTSAQPITYIGAGLSPNLTHVVGGPGNFAMWVNANYIVIQNFDFTAPGTSTALDVADNHHHITIAYNVMHDAGGDGINTTGDDYITISHNIVYGNAKNTSNSVFGSGISTLGNIDIDNNTGIKMRIDSNIVYGNTNVPACTWASCLATATDSDGNGIIIDDLRRVQRDHIPYRGRTLVSNNVVFGNGGRGIHVFLSDHVTVTDNTVFYNNQDPYEGNYRPGEINAQYASDVLIVNNILVSDGGAGIGNGRNTGTHLPLGIDYCDGNGGTGQVVAQYNLGYTATNSPSFWFGKGNSVPVTVASNTVADPKFVLPSLNAALANFQLQAGSPALGTANASTSMSTDLTGVSRSVAPSIGAIQNAAATSQSAAGAARTSTH